ncbi:deoxyguanosinetriphosphate triphosphohydrolase [Anaerotalea alkaliphila]|uniref:Deoxyguanosinetriphosphate triphosphohydrolase-like protein n=1 Tax=Anaerotalea alkaliphila TaxID=2662126 RepID=A0A7X5HTJ6_9FIRM|nr:deoxyguanosinetriphosphate triphosphohydrolase [Anaerotalea alkaliphila]NDL66176.1 deoxyguanosinetriphosphate triphosphohydrolase [Anaerotalea alkaliphila]
MNLREHQEAFEAEYLSPYAALSRNSKGREVEEPECDIRPVFQRDRDRILHSKAFRRLKHKTQVFISPEGDHYRTRLTHTLEVSQISRTIARALQLNEDLTEAIALGHDLGHTPFGHAGEYALDKICPQGFKHYEQSLRVVERLENKGKGLNLTFEVKDGILNHPSKGMPTTLEGKIVRVSDKIAYINHDIDDAVRGRILAAEDLPRPYIEILGSTSSKRISSMIHDIVRHSAGKDDILMGKEMEEAMRETRKFMFENVYMESKAKEHEDKAKNLLTQLYLYFKENTHLLPVEYLEMMDEGDEEDRVVADYIAGMTDRYAVRKFYEIFVPANWKEV